MQHYVIAVFLTSIVSWRFFLGICLWHKQILIQVWCFQFQYYKVSALDDKRNFVLMLLYYVWKVWKATG